MYLHIKDWRCNNQEATLGIVPTNVGGLTHKQLGTNYIAKELPGLTNEYGNFSVVGMNLSEPSRMEIYNLINLYIYIFNYGIPIYLWDNYNILSYY